MTTFTVDVHHNRFLAPGATSVEALVRVTGSGVTEHAAAPAAAVTLIVDASGSMQHPPTKLAAAIDATVAAIGVIDDGVHFAVVAGSHTVTPVYPEHGGLAVADPDTRARAEHAVRGLRAGGGTAIGTWLRHADRVLRGVPGAIHHAILLTDGRNESEKPAELAAALRDCAGRFRCDCRGAGADWDVDELRTIASALLGSVDIIPDASDTATMTADFVTLMCGAMAKAVDDVALRVWTPRGARVELVQQVVPSIDDLTVRRTAVSDLAGDYPTGAWGDEARDYLLRIAVPPREVGQEVLAGRVSVVLGDDAVAEGTIVAEWTDDRAQSARIDDAVADATGRAELADAIQDGIRAWRAGDEQGATALIGRAVQLAAAAGDEERLDQLEAFAHIDDAATGRVRIRPDADHLSVMVLDTRSTKTVVRAAAAAPAGP